MRSFLRILAAWLPALLLPALAAAADGAVEFLAPRHLSTVIGPTEIRLKVSSPMGMKVEKVEVLVDGELLKSLKGPPWKVMWDAGDASSDHSLHAIAHLSNGLRDHAGIRTSRLRINMVEDVDLVNLYVIVKDRSGNYVTDLTADDFRLSEDGRAQKIDRFTFQRRPLAIGLVLDTSLTMEGTKLSAAKDSALGFLEALQAEDRGMIVSFSDRVRILSELTPQRAPLAEAIRSVEAKGGTALYDAIWKTVDQLRNLDGRRVLVLLSDGRDEAANGLEPGSLHTLEEALDHALKTEVMVFAIGFGKRLDRQLDFYERYTLADILTRFGETTGGRVLFPKRAGSLRKAFEEVALDLRHQYSIAYKSSNKDRDGAWREIRLITDRPGLEVVTRHGYYAPDKDLETAANSKPSGGS